MTISYLALALIVIACLALGWLLRSYMYRTQSATTAKIDDAFKTAGNKVEGAYDSAKAKYTGTGAPPSNP